MTTFVVDLQYNQRYFDINDATNTLLRRIEDGLTGNEAGGGGETGLVPQGCSSKEGEKDYVIRSDLVLLVRFRNSERNSDMCGSADRNFAVDTATTLEVTALVLGY
jgi:hypothetical protein